MILKALLYTILMPFLMLASLLAKLSRHMPEGDERL